MNHRNVFPKKPVYHIENMCSQYTAIAFPKSFRELQWVVYDRHNIENFEQVQLVPNVFHSRINCLEWHVNMAEADRQGASLFDILNSDQFMPHKTLITKDRLLSILYDLILCSSAILIDCTDVEMTFTWTNKFQFFSMNRLSNAWNFPRCFG
jgi:hypothetical protein